MAGKNIKQLTNVTTPLLTALFYIVQNDTDYNMTLTQLKTLFNIENVEEWKTESITNGTTEYLTLEDSTTYGAIEIEYIAKRSGRGYITGIVTLLVDDSIGSGVSVSNFQTAYRSDGDDLGLTMDFGRLSSGIIQLDITADSSDANPVVLNYKILSKRPITVS
jgi:hypothetical protein